MSEQPPNLDPAVSRLTDGVLDLVSEAGVKLSEADKSTLRVILKGTFAGVLRKYEKALSEARAEHMAKLNELHEKLNELNLAILRDLKTDNEKPC
jgi:hypothetical protein